MFSLCRLILHPSLFTLAFLLLNLRIIIISSLTLTDPAPVP